MKLDDRPVIDQLLNPTPLNILEDVVADMQEYLPPRARTIADDVLWTLREELKLLDLDLSAETLERLDDVLLTGVDALTDHMGGVVWETVSEMDDRLSGRLEA
jgi:hypothetical protein